MALELMYITNDAKIASIAEKNGVDRIFVDLETLGKEERQKNMDTVKSSHTIEDIVKLRNVIENAEILVRVNPWNENSVAEIESVIKAGADRIMLPMWKKAEEVDNFLKTVNKRVKTTLLLEHKDAIDCIDEVLEKPFLDEIHIGLNDLHLSFGLTFMFELVANGTVEMLCKKMQKKGLRYGFGGIARLGQGMIPAEKIIMEHYRLGSQRAILSRSFCNCDKEKDLNKIEKIFSRNVIEIRDFEKKLEDCTEKDFIDNRDELYKSINMVVEKIKSSV